jgi:hypothetical protein
MAVLKGLWNTWGTRSAVGCKYLLHSPRYHQNRSCTYLTCCTRPAQQHWGVPEATSPQACSHTQQGTVIHWIPHRPPVFRPSPAPLPLGASHQLTPRPMLPLLCVLPSAAMGANHVSGPGPAVCSKYLVKDPPHHLSCSPTCLAGSTVKQQQQHCKVAAPTCPLMQAGVAAPHLLHINTEPCTREP